MHIKQLHFIISFLLYNLWKGENWENGMKENGGNSSFPNLEAF